MIKYEFNRNLLLSMTHIKSLKQPAIINLASAACEPRVKNVDVSELVSRLYLDMHMKKKMYAKGH